MKTLEQQLIRYGEIVEEAQQTVAIEDVLSDRSGEVIELRPPTRKRSSWVWAIVAAVIVLLLLGVLPSLTSPEPPIATDPTPPTTPELPPTTLPLPDNATSSGPILIDGLSNQLGSFEWITLEYDSLEELPAPWVTYDPAAGYRSDPGDGRLWTSPDGINWTLEEAADFDQLAQRYDDFQIVGDYAKVTTFTETGLAEQGLLRRQGAEWAQVDMPTPEELGVGIDSHITYEIEVSGDSILAVGILSATLDWESIVGTIPEFSLEAYQSGDLALEGEGSEPIPIDVVADEGQLILTYTTTGEVVHTAFLPSPEAAESIEADPTCLVFDCQMLDTYTWISADGGPFEEIAPLVGSVDGGGWEILAFAPGEFGYLHPETGEVLTTTDGVWTPTGFVFSGVAECFSGPKLDYLNMDRVDDAFRVTFACNGGAEEAWTSRDGRTWTPGPAPRATASFGQVREAGVPEDLGTMNLEVSIDGETWVQLPDVEIDTPPASIVGGSEGFTVAGDHVIYSISYELEDGTSKAWMAVGRFLAEAPQR